MADSQQANGSGSQAALQGAQAGTMEDVGSAPTEEAVAAEAGRSASADTPTDTLSDAPVPAPGAKRALPLTTSWSIANSVRIVKGEIHNVLSLMRLNRRYNTGARFHREIPSSAESPLVRELKSLHEDLGPYSDLQDMDTMAWLRPFLEVVESAETSGPITGGALSSLSKFLNYGFIHMCSPRAAQSVNRICRIVTRCRFERTDHSGDEVVLVRILQVLLDCLRCPAGTLLSDQNVWDMVQSSYDIGRQPRLSELLKRTAEHILMQMTLTLFARFSQLQACEELSLDIRGHEPLRDTLGSEHDADGDAGADGDSGEAAAADANDGLVADVAAPYGMPCMYKVLEFLCKLTHAGDTSDAAVSEASRMLGLSLLNVVLETGGRQISACPALVAVIQHDLSRNLLQNSRTSNLQILSLTLRVVFNMFNSVREHMKVQLEVFFNSIHLAESSLPETREMALESLVEFCREPQLMVDIYTNYDCDMQRTNLFEDMVKFLSKNTFPLSGSLNALNLLSLEGLLAIVRSLPDACHGRRLGGDEEGGEGEDGCGGDKTAEQLRSQKQHKRRLAMAAETFNRKPTKMATFEYLQAAGLLPATIDGASIASFLMSTPGLDRTAIGELLGDPEEIALACLKAYVQRFDFGGLHLSDALRKFLAAFRLPGESQKIARIVEHFAEHYFEQHKEAGPLANADTAYILSYAIIMLNTDLHNAQVKKKMTAEDFIKMNRGINDDKDLPAEYLMEIYQSIARDEIKMSSDLSDIGNIGDDEPRWENLLATMGQKYDKAFVAAPAMGSAHGRDMFLVSWDRIIAALSVVLETTEDNKVLRKTIEGFHDFAKICSFHKLDDEFNKLIATLSKSLFKFAELAAAQPERLEEPHWVFVRNAKVQMAAQAMFTISFSYADCLRDGWKPLLDYVAKLHKIQALPAALLEKDDLVDLQGRPLLSSRHVAIKMLHSASTRAGKGRSLLSYLWGGAAEEEEDSSAPIVTRLGMDGYEEVTAFVSSLKLEELFLNTKFLSNGALGALATALISASSRLLEQDRPEPESSDMSVSTVVWDTGRCVDSAIVCLDLLTKTALANHQRIHIIWPPMHKHLQVLLSSAQAPSLAAERTVVNQLRLCLRLTPIEAVRTDLMEGLRSLTALPASVLQSLADRISAGLLTLLRAHAAHIKEREDWRSIFSLLQEFAGMAPSASRPAFEALAFLLREEGRLQITASNIDFCHQTLIGVMDCVLDAQVAKQHVAADAAKTGGGTVSAAQVQSWQAATGANMMALMHCLFLRLRAFKTSQEPRARGHDASRGLVYLPAHSNHGIGGACTGMPHPPPAGGDDAESAAAAQAQVERTGEEVCVNRSDSVGGAGASGGQEMGVWAGGVAVDAGDEGDGFGLGDSSEDEQTWCTLWMLYVKSICRMVHDDRYSLVAAPAMHLLERALLSADVAVPYAHAWRDCYNQIIFPIVQAKFKSAGPASAGSAPSAAEALCLSTLLLLCKSFRNNLETIIHLPELHMVWLKLLGLIEALKYRIVAKQRDAVSNDIVLVLKEMLHAMHSDKTFKQVQQASGQDMWALTSTVIDAFCPDLKMELMTTSPAQAPAGAHAGGAPEAGLLMPRAPDSAGEAAAESCAVGPPLAGQRSASGSSAAGALHAHGDAVGTSGQEAGGSGGPNTGNSVGASVPCAANAGGSSSDDASRA